MELLNKTSQETVSGTIETETAKYLVSYTKEDEVLKTLRAEVIIKTNEVDNSIGTISYNEGVINTHIWDMARLPSIVADFNQIINLTDF